eukprot:gene1943-33354_t
MSPPPAETAGSSESELNCAVETDIARSQLARTTGLHAPINFVSVCARGRLGVSIYWSTYEAVAAYSDAPIIKSIFRPTQTCGALLHEALIHRIIKNSSLRGSSRNSPSVTKVEVGRRPVDPLGPSGPSPVAKAEVGRRPVDALDPSGPPPLAKAEVGRRAVMLLASSLITLLGASGTSQAAIDSLAPTAPLSPPEDAELSTGGTEFDCSKQNLSGEIAFATLKAVYLTLVEQKVMDEKQFQIENFKFKDPHKDEIPAIPDLSDLTGGLSNKVYFNFVNYSLWKTVARNLKGRDERAAFCKAAGASLLDMIWPEGVAQARDLASKRDDDRAAGASLLDMIWPEGVAQARDLASKRDDDRAAGASLLDMIWPEGVAQARDLASKRDDDRAAGTSLLDMIWPEGVVRARDLASKRDEGQAAGASLLDMIWPEGVAQARDLASKRDNGRAAGASLLDMIWPEGVAQARDLASKRDDDRAAGASLLDMIWPEGVAQARDLASKRDNGRAAGASLLDMIWPEGVAQARDLASKRDDDRAAGASLLDMIWPEGVAQARDLASKRDEGQAAGASLLDMIWPEGVAQAKDLASNRDDGRVTQAQLVMLFEGLYSKLKEGGFLCAYLISWGDLPGGWGADWMTNGVLQSDLDPPSKEEDALAAIFQVKAQQPADIGGSVALRSEEDGFWSRSLPTMSSALMTAAGYPDVIVDDYFYQDEWEGPTGLFDKFLLLIGDPLEMVDIPFTPSTLVQNFIVADM